MDENTFNQPVTKTPDTAALQDRIEALNSQMVSILVLLVVISGTLFFNMRRQAAATRSELDAIRPQAEVINATYQRLVGPGMDDFARKLADYGATHPDFQPLLAKYGVTRQGPTSPAPTGVTPAGTKAPAPAPGKK